MGKLFGTNGVRGVFGELLQIDFIYNLTRAIGTYFNGKEILVGSDTRHTSELIKKIVFAGLSSAGVTFYDSGAAPTPAHQYAVKHYNLDGGVIVTASHNPPEYNGIKLLGKNGDEIPHSEEDKVEEIFFEQRYVKPKKLSKCKGIIDPIEPYINGIIMHVDLEKIRKKEFKIVIDPACGTASLCAPKLAKILGVKAYLINSNPDGYFPSREPEPLRENLKEVSNFVVETGSDFAIAFDGDADRAIFIDNKGNIVWGDRSGAILSKHVLKKHGKGTLVVGVSASSLVEKVVKENGGDVIWTKVGSVIITEKINELLSKNIFAFGLEENGGFFYTPHQPTRDGCMSLALMLETLATENKTLCELDKELPNLFMFKTKLEAKNVDREKVIENIANKFNNYRHDRIDGIRVWLNEKEWFLIRPSGTEPIIRIFAESDSEEKAKELLKFAAELTQNEIYNLIRK
jgi:phosphomannomutase/phosphoglucomutase